MLALITININMKDTRAESIIVTLDFSFNFNYYNTYCLLMININDFNNLYIFTYLIHNFNCVFNHKEF